ncbi:hypothetical protein J2S30_001843 [Herbaspirillum rubrisubalbicans]|nr:hypothetical protein [Herbaspirillum rubrisubalbicans]
MFITLALPSTLGRRGAGGLYFRCDRRCGSGGRGRSGRCGFTLAFDGLGQDVLQFGRHRGQAVGRGAIGQLVQLVGHETAGLQCCFDGQRRHRCLAGTQGIEQVFGQVAGRHHGRQVHEPGAPLDGVECAEDRVEDFKVIRMSFQRQQMLFHVGGELQRFNDKVLEHFVIH